MRLLFVCRFWQQMPGERCSVHRSFLRARKNGFAGEKQATGKRV